jgi:integrase
MSARITDNYLRTLEPEENKKLISIRLETNLSAQIKRNSKGQITRSFVFRSVYGNGKAFTEYLGAVSEITIADARKLAQERREILKKGYIPRQYIQQRINEKINAQKEKQTTVRELVRLYELKRQNLAKNTKRGTQTILRFIDAFLNVPLSELSQTRIPYELINQCIQEGKLIKAYNTASLINQLCETGIDYNLLSHNPFTRLKRLIPTHTTKHFKTVDADNIEADLLRLFSSFLTRKSNARWFFLVGFMTLLRPAEVAGLKKSNLDTVKHILFVEKTKTLKQGWTIQTNAILERLLNFVASKRPAQERFFISSGTVKHINHFFKENNFNFSCHGWRSAGMSYLVQHGISLEVANLLLTHVVGNVVTRSYLRSDLPEQRKKGLYIWNRFILRILKKASPEFYKLIFVKR